MDTGKTSNPTYLDYRSSGFVPLLCKGYHPKYNPGRDYKKAKEPAPSGWNSPSYVPPTLEKMTAWEKEGGWIGWKVPVGLHGLDSEDQETLRQCELLLKCLNIEPGIQNTNRGKQYYFRCHSALTGDDRTFTQSGLVFTYRAGGKNYVILPPTNGRTWAVWKDSRELPSMPDEFLPYNRQNPDHILNCLSWQVNAAYREGHFSGYQDIDAAFMAFLVDCNLAEGQIRHVFQITFGPEYDEKQTRAMYERTRTRINKGDPVLGAGTFMQRVKDQGLDEVERFVRELRTLTGGGRVIVEEWPDPVPFDKYSSLPDFPTDALSGVGQEIVEVVSQVNQVDPALTACLYLASLSTSCSKKSKVDLKSHTETLNLYLCPVYDSGNRKSSTDSAMTRPLYEFQKGRQEEMKKIIQEAQSVFKIKEKRLERLQKRAAEEEDPLQVTELENQARKLALDLSENPVPKSPVYLVDDVTPEKLGVLMADNGERIAVITPEGGLFEIMAGRYSKDGIGNIDLFLKAHAGDYWSNQRIGRESKTMQTPALTLCLAVQCEVIEEAGKNHHFRGKGLLARFLYSRCKSQVGYRRRQKISIPSSLSQSYQAHVFSLMEIPLTDNSLSLSGEAQEAWDEFYTDIEKEMRPDGSLYYLPDWGSKLPGAVARIAGLLHLAEHGAKGLSLPISVNCVNASCVIGAYFKEHAIAVFGLMQEDRRFKLARQILAYVDRGRPETFRGRDIMHHTAISLMEDVEQGVRVLVDRGYIREEAEGVLNKSGPGRPSGKTYRVNPKIFERRNI